MKYVLDSNAIINTTLLIEADFYTTPEVEAELKDMRSKAVLHAKNVKKMLPKKEHVQKVLRAAEETGDAWLLSKADVSVLALALELGIVLLSDDYDVQNVAKKLGVEVQNVLFAKIKTKRRYYSFCPACKREFKNVRDGECPVCGTKLRRKWKKA